MKRFCYDYPHPAVATDTAVFTLRDGELHVALIRRGQDPFKGKLALPGGFLEEGEDLDSCAARELKEETGMKGVRLHHFRNFSDPKRDPRERVISVAYLALVPSDNMQLVAGSDAAQVEWVPMSKICQGRQPRIEAELAFDHSTILGQALSVLCERAVNTDIVLSSLPHKFTLSQMRAAIEAIIRWSPIGSRRLDKRRFRRWIMNTKIVRKAAGISPTERRPAQLYTRRRVW
jgi:ADP-ribose pyrophosphatase YjhB (NUDIX family)